jgi:hypothetical protein
VAERRDERLRLGRPLTVGAVTLLPVERVLVAGAGGARSVWLAASLEPVALVVRDGRGTWAVGVDASPGSLEVLLRTVPGLEAALAADDPA